MNSLHWYHSKTLLIRKTQRSERGVVSESVSKRTEGWGWGLGLRKRMRARREAGGVSKGDQKGGRFEG